MKNRTEDRGRPAGSTGSVPSEPKAFPPLLLVIEEVQTLSRAVGFLCEYLGVRLQSVGVQQDLRAALSAHRPIGVLLKLADKPDQDGSRALEQLAEYDRDLPIMLVTGGESAWPGRTGERASGLGLSVVRRMTTPPGIGDLTEFLVEAGRRQARRQER